MANVIVNVDHLIHGGVGYYRGHAKQIELGSIGAKRTPLTMPFHLEVHGRVPVETIAMLEPSGFEVDSGKTGRSAFGRSVIAILGSARVELPGAEAFERLGRGELRLVRFGVANDPLRELVNASAEPLRNLATWGSRARIVQQVFVLTDATLAGGGSLPVTAGTCFAYLLAKIDWNKAKTQIVDIDDDPWRLG